MNDPIEQYQSRWEGMIERGTKDSAGKIHGTCNVKNKKIVCVDHSIMIFRWGNSSWMATNSEQDMFHNDSCWDTAKDLVASTVFNA